MPKTLDGLLFDRSEFAVLLDAARTSELIGVDTAVLIPNDRTTHRNLVLEGIKKLKARNLLEQEQGINILPQDLLAMITAVAYPQLVTQTLTSTPNGNQRLFLHYLSNNVIVELTMPQSAVYRLAALPTIPAELQRIWYVLAGQNTPNRSYSFTLEQQDFLRMKELAEKGKRPQAETILRDNGVAPDESGLLIAAIESPIHSGTITMLRVIDGQIVDGRDLAFLQAETSAWLIDQVAPGSSQLMLTTTDRQNFLAKLFAHQQALASA